MSDDSRPLSAPLGQSIGAGTWLRVYLGLKLGILVLLALNTRFVMDEFWTISQPVWLFNGTFETIWPGKAVGYVLFYELAHVIGWDATSILLAARLTTVGLVVGLLWAVYRTTRALGEDRLVALLALALLLSLSTFVERSFRLRSEPLAILLAALALYTVIRGPTDGPRALLIAGLLSGLAFVTTQKAVYFNVALGTGLVLDAFASARLLAGLRRGALLVLGWIGAVLVYGLGFGGTEAYAVLRTLVTGPLDVARDGASYYEGLNQFVLQTLTRNPLAWSAMAIGLCLGLQHISRPGASRIAVIHATLITGFVAFHNQTWPYVFTMALPFLAPFGAQAIAGLRVHGRAGGVFALLFCLAIAVGSLMRNAQYLSHDNRTQLALIAATEAHLGPEDTYFDGIGMIPSRRMEPRLWLDKNQIRRALEAEAGETLSQALSGPDRPTLIIETYRTNDLADVLRPVFRDGYSRSGDRILTRDDAGGAIPNPALSPLFGGVYIE